MTHGGKRASAGRPPGKVSKAKRELADMAKDHCADALAVLVEVMTDVTAPHSARVSAANGILDRGYGKPPQAITGPGAEGAHLVTLVERIIVKATH